MEVNTQDAPATVVVLLLLFETSIGSGRNRGFETWISGCAAEELEFADPEVDFSNRSVVVSRFEYLAVDNNSGSRGMAESDSTGIILSDLKLHDKAEQEMG